MFQSGLSLLTMGSSESKTCYQEEKVLKAPCHGGEVLWFMSFNKEHCK